MCRSYFHVTCAQREGLLSEAAAEEVGGGGGGGGGGVHCLAPP